MKETGTLWTPGPWVARSGAIYAGGMLVSDCVGEQWRCKPRVDQGPTMEANARLIADAPEMAERTVASHALFGRLLLALERLPESALGYSEDEEGAWPFRNELIRAVTLEKNEQASLLTRLTEGKADSHV